MAKIIIGFSKPKTFKPFAWIIMKGYGVPYSHVYIKIHAKKYEKDLYYQASGLSVNFMSQIYFENHNEIVKEFEVEITDDQLNELMKFAIDTCGAPYGMKQVFWMAYVRAGEILGQRWSAPESDSTHTFVCSELASYVLEKFAGVTLPRLPDDMTPLDVYNISDYLTEKQRKTPQT